MDWLGEIVAFLSCGTAQRAAVFGMKDSEGRNGNTPASRGKSYAKEYEGPVSPLATRKSTWVSVLWGRGC